MIASFHNIFIIVQQQTVFLRQRWFTKKSSSIISSKRFNDNIEFKIIFKMNFVNRRECNNEIAIIFFKNHIPIPQLFQSTDDSLPCLFKFCTSKAENNSNFQVLTFNRVTSSNSQTRLTPQRWNVCTENI